MDTNVLVSGLLTPFGPGGEIVRLVSSGRLVLCLDARILLEYQEVLNRPKFKFSKEHVNTLVEFIEKHGEFVSTAPINNRLPDLDDEPFLEASIGGQVRCLITGNKAHFPTSSCQGTIVLSPAEFLDFYRNQAS